MAVTYTRATRNPEAGQPSTETTPPSPTAEAPETPSASVESTESKQKTKEYWQAKFKAARSQLADAKERQTLAEDELSLLQTQEVRALEPAAHQDFEAKVAAKSAEVEQARATALAMPILKRANRVIVLTVEGGAAVPGPTGQQLCRYLQLNEVAAKPLTVGLDGRLTGEVILFHAKALGCDLLIKGAYTQSRLRQMIFGGTTRYILSNAELPVLMAH